MNKFIKGTFSINYVMSGNSHFISDGFHLSLDKSRLFRWLPPGGLGKIETDYHNVKRLLSRE